MSEFGDNINVAMKIVFGPHEEYYLDNLTGKKLLKTWYRDTNGYYHRTNGPAIEWEDGRQEWWYHGYKIAAHSQAEFERMLRLKAFW
jgi:hypothetical protein